MDVLILLLGLLALAALDVLASRYGAESRPDFPQAGQPAAISIH